MGGTLRKNYVMHPPLAMPADERCRLDYGQGLPPIEAAGKPDQGDAGGMGGTLWLDVTLLIQSELLTEKEVFRGKGGGRPQTEPEITHTINEAREQHPAELSGVTHEAHKTYPCQGLPLRWVIVPAYYRGWVMSCPEPRGWNFCGAQPRVLSILVERSAPECIQAGGADLAGSDRSNHCQQSQEGRIYEGL
jgi:hypothetical protein